MSASTFSSNAKCIPNHRAICTEVEQRYEVVKTDPQPGDLLDDSPTEMAPGWE
ncbi:Calcium-binding and spermatid-specific protein 1 [Anopheles sinensis]|uniref:Calcium-binding and spermatid-specific protein 1 n=1 Tax=Anopheles sinensis TaxID=74873 RepID=A0A084WUE1_ANOSI|nr:Calcium-binding and spermatid-specific protein 1 [Anopheles sinensis]